MVSIKHAHPVKSATNFTIGDPTKITAEVRAKFLEEYAKCGCQFDAAEACGVSQRGINYHMQADPEFAEQVANAKARWAARTLKKEMFRRAHDGVERTIVQGGKVVLDPATNKPMKERIYSDRLLEVMAKAHDPELRDRSTIDINVKCGVLVVFPYMTEEQCDAMWGGQRMSPNPLDGLPGLDQAAMEAAMEAKRKMQEQGYDDSVVEGEATSSEDE